MRAQDTGAPDELAGAGMLVGAAHALEASAVRIQDDLEVARGWATGASPRPPIVWTELGPSGLIARVDYTEPYRIPLCFGPGRPPQLVVGNSGTALDPPVTTPLPGLEIAGVKVAGGVNLAEFGFVVLERHHRRWTATLRNVEGAPLLRCALGETSLTCEPANP